MAGYIWKAIENSPLKSRSKARWKPHPKHSIPKSVLLKQGIINFSKSNGFSFYNFTKKKETIEIIKRAILNSLLLNSEI